MQWYTGTVVVQCILYNAQCTLLKTAVDVLYFNYRKTIYRIVGTGKHAYYYMPYVMLTNHVISSNYMAQKPSNFYIFF